MNKRKYKVLVLPSWYLPDGGGFFKDHAETLNHGDFEVDILVNRVLGLTSHSFYQIWKSLKKRERKEGPLQVTRWGYLRIPRMERYNIRAWAKKYLTLFDYYLEHNEKPDIIIAHSCIWAGYVAARIKEEYKIPFILVEHRGRFARNIEATQRMIREWYFPYIRKALVQANKIITVSKALDNQLISISPGIVNKIETIPNLIDTDYFKLPEKPRTKDPFLFIAFGTLEYVKGFDILIKAFASFVRKHEGDFMLRIGGRGSKYRKLKMLARKYGVADRVNLHGYVPREEVLKEMQRANIFILPSRFEAFGVVLIEAMSTGCPVISTYSGGPESIVKHTDGLLVESDNVEELEAAMEKIYLNYEDYKPELIRKDVVENYAMDVIRDKYHLLIKNILDGKDSIIS